MCVCLYEVSLSLSPRCTEVFVCVGVSQVSGVSLAAERLAGINRCECDGVACGGQRRQESSPQSLALLTRAAVHEDVQTYRP